MPIDLAERIYQFAGIGVIALAFIVLFSFHRAFWGDALIERPDSLSEGRLRHILAYGKMAYRSNAGTPKGEEITRRMQLALEELRRRRGEV